jgi:hypothetical protein
MKTGKADVNRPFDHVPIAIYGPLDYILILDRVFQLIVDLER